MWYGTGEGSGQGLVPVPAERVSEVQAMNRNGKIPEELIEFTIPDKPERLEYTDGAGVESLTRFENEKSRKKKKQRHPRNHPKDR
jgi:hypothetical protein